MRVRLRNPDRMVEVSGPSTVGALLAQLDIVPEAVLVIRDATLLTRDESVDDDDELEVRPVLSGGADATATSGHEEPARTDGIESAARTRDHDEPARTAGAPSDGSRQSPERSGARRPQPLRAATARSRSGGSSR